MDEQTIPGHNIRNRTTKDDAAMVPSFIMLFDPLTHRFDHSAAGIYVLLLVLGLGGVVGVQ